MKKLISLMIVLLTLTSCISTGDKAQKTNMTDAFIKDNLFETGNWFATTDEYGSYYEMAEEVIVDGEINVNFYITQKLGDEWPYIELVCESGRALTGMSSITLEYKCDKSVEVKLSQSDFGEEGDNSYANFYYEIPEADEWTTITLEIQEFYQPGWSPSESTEVGLVLGNVTDIYLVPTADYNFGEEATLAVRSLIIEQK